jgi:ribosomal protein L34
MKLRIRKSTRKARRKFGFLARKRTAGGRAIANRRRRRGRQLWDKFNPKGRKD